jgi:hypothetical protein
MLNNLQAFTASNMVGESMKQGRSNSKPKNLAPTTLLFLMQKKILLRTKNKIDI